MIKVLIFTLWQLTVLAKSLDQKQEVSNEEIQKVLSKYIEKIPDLEPKYVINEGLSKMISSYYKNKINTFPLYKISLKIDRKPVIIPWTITGAVTNNATGNSIKYSYAKVRKDK